MRNSEQKRLAKRLHKTFRRLRREGKPGQADMMLVKWARVMQTAR